MMQASIYGRLAFDPTERTTKSGKPRTTERVEVEVGKDAEEQHTMWIDILAFGRSADDLARLGKGAMVSAIGRLTRGTWIAKDGAERGQWTLMADGLMSARSPNPATGRSEEAAAYEASQRFQAPPADFNDDIAF